MKKLYTLALLFLAPLLSIAQSNYKSGSIVNLKGDTVKGYINYKEWTNNPIDISFKTELTGTPKAFTAKELTYFEINGYERYKGCIVSVSQGSVDPQKLRGAIDSTASLDTVFLKVLAKGKNVTLYSYFDGVKRRFYIMDKSMSIPQELLYQLYLNPDELNKVIRRNIYYSQLSALANKYSVPAEEFEKKARNLKYEQDDLIDIVTLINGGNDAGKGADKIKKGKAASFFGGLAIAQNTFKYIGDKSYSVLVGNSTSVTMPQLSAGMDVYANPNIGKLIFRLEFGATIMNYDVSNTSTSGLGFTGIATQKANQVIITGSPQMVYNFYNTDALKIYADIGVCFHLEVSHSNNYTTQTLGFNDATTVSDYPELAKYWASYPLEAGVVLNKKIDIGFAYVGSVALVPYIPFTGTITSYQLGVNYYFK